MTACLQQHGLWDKTLFIFSTDNGGPLNGMANNYPLQGTIGFGWAFFFLSLGKLKATAGGAPSPSHDEMSHTDES